MRMNIILILLISISSFNLIKAQELFTNQNPNYKSMDKDTTNNVTQLNYGEQKMLRKYHRQQRRLARINNRDPYNSFYSYNPYNYYNPYVYNYGYPPYTYKPYCGLNTAVNLLGIGIYWFFTGY